MNKKAIDFTFSTLIGIAILVFVMVVIFLLLSGKITLFVRSNECQARGGFCTQDCEYTILYLDGCNNNEVCCLKPT